MLRQLGQELVKRATLTEAAEAATEPALEGMRASRSEIERLIAAMVDASKVQQRIKQIMGKDADPVAFLERVRSALFPVVVNEIQRAGGKVSGASAAGIKTDLRGMAKGEDTRDKGPELDEAGAAVVPSEDDPGTVSLTRIERMAEWVVNTPRMQALLQRAGVANAGAALTSDLVIMLTSVLQRNGAKVSGMSASKVKTQLRALAMGEDATDSAK